MLVPPTPPDEGFRLEALRGLGLLDTPAEARFDRITRTAARLFGVPTALVSLVDGARQWFKSRVGLEACETHRDISFCGHAVLQDGVLVVEDAARDSRFADNPLVTGPPFLRFYAGCPLRTADGFRVGTLCLLAPEPRAFGPGDVRALEDLAAWAERELQTRSDQEPDAERRYQTVVAALAEGIVLQDPEGRILASNASARRILGLTEDELHGRTSRDPAWGCIRPDGSAFPGDDHPAMVALRTGEPQSGVEMGVRLPSGTLRWITINARPLLRPGEPRPYAVLTSFADITARRAAEDALREAEARFRGLYEHTSDGIFWVDMGEDGTPTYGGANPTFLAASGIEAEAMRGRRPEEILPPDLAAHVSAQYRHCWSTGQPVRYQHNLDVQGHWRAWETLLVPLPDRDGRIHRLAGISRDLTERHQLEETLRATAAFQRSLLECAGSSIIATDPEGTILSINAAGERMLGWTAEELVGHHTPALFHDPDEVAARAAALTVELGRPVAPGFEAFVAKARQGQVETREWTYLRRNGTRLPVALTVTTIGTPEGGITGFMGIASDLSAQKAAEQELRLMAELARRTDNGVAIADAQGNVQWVNEGFTRLTGFTLDEVRGQRPGTLLQGPDTSPETVQKMAERLRAGEGFRVELVNYRKDGQRYWVSLEVQPLRDAQGRITGYMGLQSDITPRKEAERMKDEFISVVSHELRTPLTAIRGSLGLLVGGAAGSLQPSQLDMLRIAYQNVDRLGRLVNDILDLQKIEAGRMSLDLRVQDMAALVALAMQAIEPFAASRGVRFRFEPPSEPATARVDGDRVQQIVVNLLSNAIKFSPAEESVVVRLSRADATVRLEIEDHGPGIPEAFQRRIFQKFAQADATSTRAQGGTGLGLSIVKTLCEQMGGQAGFRSSPGCTIFFATFPLAMEAP